jgi:hypothetical protein
VLIDSRIEAVQAPYVRRCAHIKYIGGEPEEDGEESEEEEE